MVRGGVALLNSIHMVDLLDKITLKVPALVRVEVSRHTKPAEPIINQHSGHCRCLLVVGWDSLGILRKNISHDQDVLHPIL